MSPLKNVLPRILSLATLLFLAGCETFQETPDSDTFIFLDPEETLYVRMIIAPDLMMEQAYPELSETVKERRYEQYLTSMRSLLQIYRFPMDVYLLEELESPGEGPLLELFAVRWEQDRMGEIKVTLKAKLERYGELNTLGTFTSHEMPSVMSNYERSEQVFVRTMEDALTQMFNELNKHFETPAEEAFVQEPLDS
ncbi:hypothetical protein [Pelagicoccus sp. SDUM812005]|uniref:hypothetical protein n=1 Tax=Pelagicoccus sp. SDUM812005 TaxID=3041257 RepID=UPI00280EBA40|nr:hypothetical protein [Pelagicoccus sp. SDUM812005]MDQ8180622.1 hypothetical protein [Pelagicoccus sp. SDUM812005]